MLQNSLLIALRNLARHKTFSLINIGGLAISLASCLFIFYYVYDELTFDRSHTKADRIYRITQTFIAPEATQHIRFTHQKVGPYLHRLYPQVENFVRFQGGEARVGKSRIKETGVVKADPSVLQIFTYPLIEGNAETALERPGSMVLSETLARKYFTGKALGNSLEVDGQVYDVTGVMEDVPPNSDKWISAIIRGEFKGEESPGLNFMYDTYILLKDSEDATFLRKQLPAIADDLHHNAEQPVKMGLNMQALTDLHFFHGIEMDNPKGNKTNVYIFGVVAIILILVAVFNFINLTTVRSLERAREVGIRKAAGAQRHHLVRQFLSESFLSVLLAALISFGMINILNVIFKSVCGKTINLGNKSDVVIIGTALVVLIGVAVLASLYPAWILSSYKPALVLKGKVRSIRRGSVLREVFTAGQFALSGALLLFLVVMLSQMNFMRNADLGFTREEILMIKIPDGDSLAARNPGFYKSEFSKHKSVEQISIGGFASHPGTKEPMTSPLWISGKEQKRELIVPNITVDKHYPTLLKLKMKEGRSFSDMEGESVQGMALVNESFVKLAGWDQPIGQTISTFAGQSTVIGVVRDFHFQSLHNTIEPLAITGMDDRQPDARYFFVKTSASNLNDIKVLWRKLFQGQEPEYFFLNEFFDAQYKADENLRLLFLYFTLLTIAISVSGLLGLTLYHVEIRTREIGIRKVLGAGIPSIIRWLAGGFVKLTLAGTTIGVVAGVLLADQWLKNFAYRTEIDVLTIAGPALAIVLLSCAVIGYKVYHGAARNPVETLKHE